MLNSASTKYAVAYLFPKSAVFDIWPMHTGVNDRMEPVKKPYVHAKAHKAPVDPPKGSHITRHKSALMEIVIIITLNLPKNLSAMYPGTYLPSIPDALYAVSIKYATFSEFPLAIA